MKLTLISLDPELYCIGIRTLSSCLKQTGHTVQCIFLPPDKKKTKEGKKYRETYPRNVLEQLSHLCEDSQLVGISLMTNQYLQAVCVTKHIKTQTPGVKVIWGGIHPTVEPEACLEYADMVCLGEGEHALVELANRMDQNKDYVEVKNIWARNNNDLVRNQLNLLIQELDAIPYPDYSCNGHYVLLDGCIRELNVERLIAYPGERYRADHNKINYPIMTSRGCPYSCTYCCNSVFKKLYPHQRHMRWRSAGSVIGELRMIREQITDLNRVYFVDDNFTARSDDKLAYFCREYKREIDVPYFAQISPLTINEEKVNILLNSGCSKIVMGVETGNARIAQLYNRAHSHKAMPAGIALLEKYRSKMPLPPTYQFIIDNPYESRDEILDTLRLAVSLPRPWDNPIYSLMLFPGTVLYERAIQDGHILDKREQVYAKDWLDHSKSFYRIWIRLYRANVPPSLLKLLLRPWVAKILTQEIAEKILHSKLFSWLWKKT